MAVVPGPGPVPSLLAEDLTGLDGVERFGLGVGGGLCALLDGRGGGPPTPPTPPPGDPDDPDNGDPDPPSTDPPDPTDPDTSGPANTSTGKYLGLLVSADALRDDGPNVLIASDVENAGITGESERVCSLDRSSRFRSGADFVFVFVFVLEWVFGSGLVVELVFELVVESLFVVESSG